MFLLGYWGIFAIPFKVPGYSLALFLKNNDKYCSLFYNKNNGRLSLKIKPQRPTQEIINYIVNNEITEYIIKLSNELHTDPAGIINPCNICYVSVILQILCHNTSLIKFFVSINDQMASGKLVPILLDLAYQLATKSSACDIISILDYFFIDPTIQEDCFTFLSAVITMLEFEILESEINILQFRNLLFFHNLDDNTYPEFCYNVEPEYIDSINFGSLEPPITVFINVTQQYFNINTQSCELKRHKVPLSDVPLCFNGKLYYIYAVICFDGNDNCGHYTVYIKENDNIKYFNDDKVVTLYKRPMKSISHNCITGIVLLSEGNSCMMRLREEGQYRVDILHQEIIEEENILPGIQHKILILLTTNDFNIKDITDLISASNINQTVFISILYKILNIRSNQIELYVELFININFTLSRDFKRSFILTMLSQAIQEQSFFIYLLFQKGIISEDELVSTLSVIKFDKNNINVFIRFAPEIYQHEDIRRSFLEAVSHLNIIINGNFIDYIIEHRDVGKISTKIATIIENDSVDEIDQLIMENRNDILRIEDDYLGRSSLINSSTNILIYAIYTGSIKIISHMLENYNEYFYHNNYNGMSVLDTIVATGNNKLLPIFQDLSLLYNDTVALYTLNYLYLEKKYNNKVEIASEFLKEVPLVSINDNYIQNGWDIIANSYYSSQKECFEVLKYHAANIGFELGFLNGRRSNDTVTIVCTYGMPTNNRTKTTKTGCGFRINVTSLKDGRVHAILKCGEHKDHDIHPQMTAHLLLSCELKEQISKMNDSNIGSDAISQYIFSIKGLFLVPQQIRKILIEINDDDNNVSETSELIEYIIAHNGIVFSYPEVGQPKEAVLTFTREELTNMAHADCIYTDGTNFSNRLKWMCHPITTLNPNLKTKSIGTLFTSIFDKRIANWFLTKLFFCTPLIKTVRTFTTDEDSSIISVAEEIVKNFSLQFNKPLSHLLCAYHKSMNFNKHLHTKGETRETQKKLWNLYVYSRSEEVARKAFKELYQISDKTLRHYLDNNVIPYENKIIMCMVKECRTYNHNTSGIGENFNFQIKRFLPNRLYTLLQMKQEIIRITTKSFYIDLYKDNHQLKSDDLIKKNYGLTIYSKPQMLLMKSIYKSQRLKVEDQSDRTYKIYDLIKDNFEIISISPGSVKCSCEKVANMGLPCSHIICYLSKTEHRFPIEMIDNRYIKGIEPSQNGQFDFSTIPDDIEETVKKNEPKDGELSDKNEKQLYDLLLYELKEFAKIGAESPESANYILHRIASMRDKLQRNTNGDADYSQGNKNHRMKRIRASYEK